MGSPTSSREARDLEANPSERGVSRAVILQIDQDVPTVVEAMFQTAANAGYANISFMSQHDAQHASAR
jgi:hypothetical protein